MRSQELTRHAKPLTRLLAPPDLRIAAVTRLTVLPGMNHADTPAKPRHHPKIPPQPSAVGVSGTEQTIGLLVGVALQADDAVCAARSIQAASAGTGDCEGVAIVDSGQGIGILVDAKGISATARTATAAVPATLGVKNVVRNQDAPIFCVQSQPVQGDLR